VFCWGWNLHGQCGQGTPVDIIELPSLVIALAGLQADQVHDCHNNVLSASVQEAISGLHPCQVLQVAAGAGHTVCSLEDGSCYAWGLNADGQACSVARMLCGAESNRLNPADSRREHCSLVTAAGEGV